MRYRKIVLQIIALAVCAAVLSGCGEEQAGQAEPGTVGVSGTGTEDMAKEWSVEKMESGSVESVAGSLAESSETTEGSAAEPPADAQGNEPEPLKDGMEQESSEQARPMVYTLPATGRELSDFVAEGWELMDSVELDYNGDGITDYVGVQETSPDEGYYVDCFRILFAIVSEGAGQYRLDFQDENLIRTRTEGGVFGDPYEPLTAEGASFTTHAFGGSAWKWSEANTYTYRDGTWYLSGSEYSYGYGPYITHEKKEDWERGIRTQRMRSDDFDDMEQHWGTYEFDPDDGVFDLEYEMELDEPPTLYQAGKRWWLALDRVTDWEVREIVLAEGIELSQEMIQMPETNSFFHYCDEDCMLYTFSIEEQDDDKRKYYLAMYRWQDKSLTVLAEEEGKGYSLIDDPMFYKDRIYYSTEVRKHIAYMSTEKGETRIREKDCVIGRRLNRINLDGTDRETIFEYLYPGTDQPLLPGKPPYIALIIMDISGGEAIVEVYIGNNEPDPVYRMNVDGSRLRQIGQIPME